MRLRLAFVAAALLLGAPASLAQSLPPEVRAAIAEQKASCAPDKSVLGPGFVTRRDINGDGIDDVILDYGSFRCGDSASYFCGTAGCTQQVFASLPNGRFAKVFDENARSLDFRTIKRRPALLLHAHGSACNRTGVETCRMTLYWNGLTFKGGR